MPPFIFLVGAKLPPSPVGGTKRGRPWELGLKTLSTIFHILFDLGIELDTFFTIIVHILLQCQIYCLKIHSN